MCLNWLDLINCNEITTTKKLTFPQIILTKLKLFFLIQLCFSLVETYFWITNTGIGNITLIFNTVIRSMN